MPTAPLPPPPANLFGHEDYKSYLAEVIDRDESRGQKSRWAEAMKCHVTYVSQVLRGASHFSGEQTEALSRYLRHSEAELEYFLLLVQVARAGTPSLRDHYLKRVRSVQAERLVLKNRLQFKNTITDHDREKYYSAWHYSAIHILCSVPSIRSRKDMSTYLGLSSERVREALEFLQGAGLVRDERGRLEYVSGSLHLPADSPLVSKHHVNWRVQAMRSLEDGSADDLHYSSVVSLSREDVPRIKELVVRMIEEIRAVVRDSPEEDVFCYDFDLFGLNRRS